MTDADRTTDAGAARASRVTPVILSVALFMENMDSSVIATSLPTIAADLGTSPIALKLALTSYYVALAVFIPISGRLADRFGASLVFRLAILVFALGSVACAQAGSLGAFVAARFLQGMGGAMMTPVGRLLLVRSTAKSDLVAAMAWFTMPAMVGPLLGPPIGGAITTWAHWSWIFYVNVPIGLAGMLLAARFLPRIAGDPAVRFDWRGFALSAMACAGMVFGASVISLPVLPPAVGLAMLGAGAASAALYLRHARRRPDPLLRLSLLRIETFRASVSAGFLFRVGVGAIPFLLPLLLQLGFGFTAFQSGLITCTAIGGAMGMKALARPILRRLGFRATLTLAALAGGALAAPLGLWRPEAPLALLLALLLAGGFVRSLFFTAVNALGFCDIPAARAGDATAILAVGQPVAIAMGVAMAGALLEALLALRGTETLRPADFTVAFAVVGAVSALAAVALRRLDPDAGSEVSGARRTTPEGAAAPAGPRS
jgi:EmrB/QacA subfamily drug resistance transporter